ncbi:MAG: hypothetical protein U5O39_02415 [Gammaproteobacteria bacterium]|nr:hypothetical protein [Gammaproteobacteria bacterium]
MSVAREQLALGRRKRKAPRQRSGVAQTTSNGARMQAGNALLEFDDEGLKALSIDDVPVLTQGPLLNIWRAPLDNDGIKGRENQNGKPLGRWRELGIRDIERIAVERDLTDSALTFDERWKTPGGEVIELQTSFGVTAGEDIRISHRFTVPAALADLPRLGVRLQLPSAFESLRWFGRGPHETYADRKQSGEVRIHASTVTDQYVPYILPQDHGNLTDVRWVELASSAHVLRVTADREMEASASHYPHESHTRVPYFRAGALAPHLALPRRYATRRRRRQLWTGYVTPIPPGRRHL